MSLCPSSASFLSFFTSVMSPRNYLASKQRRKEHLFLGKVSWCSDALMRHKGIPWMFFGTFFFRSCLWISLHLCQGSKLISGTMLFELQSLNSMTDTIPSCEMLESELFSHFFIPSPNEVYDDIRKNFWKVLD